MIAFISYSHQDSAMLDHLHTHLSPLKCDHLISTWTDRQIDETIESVTSFRIGVPV